MKAEQKVSVIVPVYNVERFLKECVDSILSQTYKYFELILVDDGSTDSSGYLCDEYAKKDSRIRVLHKKNGGLSDARNKGIEIAKGSYITFIDSDDCVSPEYLEILIECAIKENVEIVQGLNTSDRSRLGTANDYGGKLYRTTKEVMCDYLLFKYIVGYACNKLYARRLFDTLRFPVGKIQEDAWTTYKALYEARGVAVIGINSYYYRINNTSIMNGSFRSQRFDIMDVPEDIRNYLKMKNAPYNYRLELEYYTMRIGFKTYNDCLIKGNKDVHRDKMNKLREIIISIPPNKIIWEKKYILMRIILIFCPQMYDLLIRKMRKKKGSLR